MTALARLLDAGSASKTVTGKNKAHLMISLLVGLDLSSWSIMQS